MNKKILLPTDFSENSLNAINYALELYKNDTCDFFLLNAYLLGEELSDVMTVPVWQKEMIETADVESKEGLKKIVKTIQSTKSDKHTLSTISRMGDALQAIKDVVEEKDIEMIVMGTKGASDFKNKLFGGTATYVMEKVRNCPAIIVPKTAAIQLPKEIVFPTSYKTHFKKRELQFLVEIAQKSNAAIRILHVSEEDALDKNQLEHRKMLEEYFENLDFSFHTLSGIKIQQAVNCFVESRGSDMVTFINKKHAFFGSLFTHPLVKGIGYTSKVPILVLHDLRN